MSEFLMRENAPLSQEQWDKLDKTVVEVAKANLVGRRFIEVFGPLGAGMQSVSIDVFETSGGAIDLCGEEEDTMIKIKEKRLLPMPIVYKDFTIHWRDMESSKQLGLPFDTSVAAAASAFCAMAEDKLIFYGDKGLGHEGLLTVKGTKKLKRSDWMQEGKAFEDVVKATEALLSAGFYGPYALVVSPQLYATMNRVYKNTGILEIEQVKKLATGGVFQSPALKPEDALVVSVGPQNMDLAISQDLVTSYMGEDKMNYMFRVFEVIGLRIKQPGSICILEK
jgi:uncharacterized linocin/CFP29 family protein